MLKFIETNKHSAFHSLRILQSLPNLEINAFYGIW
jgi:hypothetical protein